MLVFLFDLIKIMPISDGMYYSIAPIVLAAGITALGGIIQSATASSGKKEEPYQIPEELKKSLREAEMLKNQGLPETSRVMAQQSAQQAALFGLRSAREMRKGFQFLAPNQALYERSLLDIANRDAIARQQNQQNYIRALTSMGQEQKLKFQTNYMAQQNAEQQAREQQLAGYQNIMRGIDTAASYYTMYGGGGGGNSAANFGGTNLSPVSSGITGRSESTRNAFAALNAPTMTSIPVSAMGGMPGSQRLPYTYPILP
jgi:hypothetical protein